MTSIVGNAAAIQAFLAATARRNLHHAWLIAGPQGVGKARFARAAAAKLLADAVQPGLLAPDTLDLPEGNKTAALLASGAHPDFREMARQPKDADKPDGELARSIPIAQVRALQPMLATKPALAERRVIVIDAIDDLERPAANALLKNLEEPPAGTIFLLISHAPGRLLPTIRSRCRLLRFDPLDDAEMAAVLHEQLPEALAGEIDALVRAGAGSPGRALRFAGLDLDSLEEELSTIARDGDPTNARRVKLAKTLGTKFAQERYEAFLERVPAFIADHARSLTGAALKDALDAYDAARGLAAQSLAQSLDAVTTAFEMGGLVARLAPRR